MAPEHVQAARCVRCGLAIASTGGEDALKQQGWVEIEGEREEKGKKPVVRPMICPTCAKKEREHATGRQ